MAFQQRVLTSAPRHTQLLISIEETSYAAVAAQQTEAYISQLEGQIATETKTVEKLHWKVSKERAEYETFHKPHLNHSAGNLIGTSDSFTAKSEKEHEYNDVVEAQVKATRNLETLKANLQEAQAKLPGLKREAELHITYQSELTSLYDTLFSPPHPPFLTLDIATSLLARAQASHTAASQPFDAACQAVQLLTDGQKCLSLALNSVTSALDSRRKDTEWGVLTTSHPNPPTAGPGKDGSGPANAIAIAQGQAREAEGLLGRARRLEPKSVQQIAATQVAQPDFWVSCGAAVGSQGRGGKRVPFNIVRFKERVDVAERDLKRALAECAREVNAAKERVALLKGKVDEARERLEDAELGVSRAREEIFRRVVDGEDLGEDVGFGGGLFGEMRPLELLPSYVP
jgi:chromosome segregation ATPase